MRLGNLNALNMAFSKVGLTAGTTTTYTTTVATDFIVNGVFGTQFGTKTNQATPTTDWNTAAAFTALAVNKGSVFVWGCIAAGTVKVCQGSVEDLDASGNFKVAPKFPAIPDTMVPFGYFVVKNDSTGSTWTFGSSNWTATGITVTATNVALLPPRPVTS
jgi:hypothetical protein